MKGGIQGGGGCPAFESRVKLLYPPHSSLTFDHEQSLVVRFLNLMICFVAS